MLRSTLLLTLALTTTALATEPQLLARPATDASAFTVAKATMKSGAQVVMNYRQTEPPKVNRAVFQWRVAVSCHYLDRGDGSGLPAVDALHKLQQLEAALENPASAIRMWSRTGEAKREALFQVKDKTAFTALVQAESTKLVLECTLDVGQDPRWTVWADTVKALTAKEKPVGP
jgi:hypothetical protein